MYRRAIGILLLLSAATILGCAHQRQVAASVEPFEVASFDETLGVDDVFDVRVVGEAEISGPYRVAADGSIDFPFVGRVQVLGLRPGEVQRLLSEKLRDGYYRNPQLTVMVKEWNSRKIAVLGQVQKPGPILYFPHMTIVDAIAAAGGFTEVAAKNSVTVRREANGKVQTRNYRVADISEGRSPNVGILPGDVLVVEERLF